MTDARPVRRPRASRRGTPWGARLALGAAYACAAALLLSACQGPDDVIREKLAEWDVQMIRNAWSCDAMGRALGQWLDLHAEELEEAVVAVAEHASALDDEEQRAYLAETWTGRRRAEVDEARATCSAHPTVHTALQRMTTILEPIVLPLAPEPIRPTREAS